MNTIFLQGNYRLFVTELRSYTLAPRLKTESLVRLSILRLLPRLSHFSTPLVQSVTPVLKCLQVLT